MRERIYPVRLWMTREQVGLIYQIDLDSLMISGLTN